jgi:8-oxo-dGTP diphosphatase
MNYQSYAAGFLFSDDGSQVALVRKNRPDWQAGLLNGVGGKWEPHETRHNTMVREFYEEAGVRVPAWESLAWMRGDDYDIGFYRAFSSKALSQVYSVTDEAIEVHDTRHVLQRADLMPNLYWLLPLAVNPGVILPVSVSVDRAAEMRHIWGRSTEYTKPE